MNDQDTKNEEALAEMTEMTRTDYLDCDYLRKYLTREYPDYHDDKKME